MKVSLTAAWRVSNSWTRDFLGLGWNSQGTGSGGVEPGVWLASEGDEVGAVSCELSISWSQKLGGFSYSKWIHDTKIVVTEETLYLHKLQIFVIQVL